MITVKAFSLPSWNVPQLIMTLKIGNAIEITTNGKGNAPHSSILAWRIPRKEEPGRLQSRWSQESDTTLWLNHHPIESSLSWWLRLQRLCLLMQEIQVPSLDQKDPLEKGMTFHSSILAWRIPWTEEPGGLQSMGSQRVRHDWLMHTTAKKNTICLYWAFHIQHFALSAMLSTLNTLFH